MAIYGENTKKQLTCDWETEQDWTEIGRGIGALVELCEKLKMDAEVQIQPDYDGKRMIYFKMKEREKE